MFDFLMSTPTRTPKIREKIDAIAYLALSPSSSGIVNNETDDVIWRNSVSTSLMKRWKDQSAAFQIPENMKVLHNILVLNHIRERVNSLSPVKNWNKDYLLITYTLVFPEIGFVEVQDKFYRLDIEGVVYRIWINIFSRRLPHALS